MNLQQFKDSLNNDTPPAGISGPLQALWQAGKGDWKTAHEITQNDDSVVMAWVHAYLHRDEGDLSNARYWYARAGKPESTASLEAEWAEIVSALLAG